MAQCPNEVRKKTFTMIRQILYFVLIIMQLVSTQGVNLDRAYRWVVVVTSASNAPLEWQGWGRALKIFFSFIFTLSTQCVDCVYPDYNYNFSKVYWIFTVYLNGLDKFPASWCEFLQFGLSSALIPFSIFSRFTAKRNFSQ